MWINFMYSFWHFFVQHQICIICSNWFFTSFRLSNFSVHQWNYVYRPLYHLHLFIVAFSLQHQMRIICMNRSLYFLCPAFNVHSLHSFIKAFHCPSLNAHHLHLFIFAFSVQHLMCMTCMHSSLCLSPSLNLQHLL